MASGTMKWFRGGLRRFLDGSIDYTTNTIKVALHTSAYTASSDGDDYYSEGPGAAQVSGTGYTYGGAALGTKSINVATARIARLIAADPSWASSYISAKGAVVYASTAASTTSPLICYVAFDATTTSSNGTFTLDLDGTNGFLYLRASV